jgi:hypothetical protein
VVCDRNKLRLKPLNLLGQQASVTSSCQPGYAESIWEFLNDIEAASSN